MTAHPRTLPPSLGLHLGSETLSADGLADAARRLDVDWSCVFGGDVRLAGQEWSPVDVGNRLMDAGGDWLLVVPVSAIPDPFLPTPDGFLGPVGHERIALATWLLLASLPCSGLPDILLVAAGVGLTPSPAPDPRRHPLWSWPRAYRYAVGFFDPAGSYADGNTDFADALGLSEAEASPAWLAPLRLPCACAALGRPQGTDAGQLTWSDLGASAARLCEVALTLGGAIWPRGERGAVPAWEVEDLTPATEQQETQDALHQAHCSLPSWTAAARTAGITPGQIEDLRTWTQNSQSS